MNSRCKEVLPRQVLSGLIVLLASSTTSPLTGKICSPSHYNRRNRKRSTENDVTNHTGTQNAQQNQASPQMSCEMQGMCDSGWQGRQAEQFLQKRDLQEKECLLHADEVAPAALAASIHDAAAVGTASGPYPPYYLPYYYPGGGALGLPTKSIKTTNITVTNSTINSRHILT